MRAILRTLGLCVLVLLAFGVYLWWVLRPPPLAPVAADGHVVANVTIVEPGLERVAGQTLAIVDGRIASVRSATPDERSSRGLYSNAYVLPGLIDMHVHQGLTLGGLGDYAMLLYLAHGVTAVRDTGSLDGSIWTARARIQNGELAGPRIFACGPIVDGEPPLWPESVVAAMPDQGRETVARLASEGVHCIKIYSRMKLDVLAAVREAAHEHGLPVIGHVPDGVPFEEARLDDVQHLIGVVDPVHVAPDSYPMVAGWSKLTDARVGFIVETSASRGIVHTPTLVYLDRTSRLDQWEEQAEAPGARLLPRAFRDVFWRPPNRFRLGGSVTPDTWPAFRDAFEKAKSVVRALHRAGVRVHAGTDTGNPFIVPGVSLHEELRLFVDSGLTPEEAWVAATRWPGEFLPEPGLGRLQPGAPADLLVFREDPTRDLVALETLQAVVAQGRLYPKADLDREVARYRAHFHGFGYDRVVTTLARLIARLRGR